MRIPVMKADETVPLVMPADELTQQRWWLAFLQWGRRSASAELMEATLAQLKGEQLNHPEAELSRAAIEALRGWSDAARMRIDALRKAYPHDAIVHAAIDEVVVRYERLF
jgi:hypothetical protein